MRSRFSRCTVPWTYMSLDAWCKVNLHLSLVEWIKIYHCSDIKSIKKKPELI